MDLILTILLLRKVDLRVFLYLTEKKLKLKLKKILKKNYIMGFEGRI